MSHILSCVLHALETWKMIRFEDIVAGSVVLIAIGIALLSSVLLPCKAEPGQFVRVYNNDNEHAGEFLSAMPELPYLPQYSGKIEFERAVRWQKSGGRVAFSITFQAKEMPEAVIDWYREVFRQNRWQEDSLNAGPKLAEARLGRFIHCRVMAMHSRRKDYPANIHLTYAITGQEPSAQK